MRRFLRFSLLFILLFVPSARAADFTGTWQAALGEDGKSGRTVIRIAQVEGWTAAIYVIDVDPAGFLSEGVTVEGGKIKIVARPLGGFFEGELSADGNAIIGTWTGSKATRALTFRRATPETAWPLDTSPHNSVFITSSDGVRLEVLDWGGTGRPLIFIPGLIGTAHIFDQLVPQLAADFRVIGITRRGRGNSAKPEPATASYSATRLGDDVLEVMEALKLEKPVLIGHSFGGSELSSVATRHPEKIAGAVYLEAAYEYAYYDPAIAYDPGPQMPPPQTLDQRITQAMRAGQQRFSRIEVPVVAVFATGRTREQGDLSAEEFAARQKLGNLANAQIESFANNVKGARIVRLPNAAHYLWLTHAGEIIRELKNFTRGLSP